MFFCGSQTFFHAREARKLFVFGTVANKLFFHHYICIGKCISKLFFFSSTCERTIFLHIFGKQSFYLQKNIPPLLIQWSAPIIYKQSLDHIDPDQLLPVKWLFLQTSLRPGVYMCQHGIQNEDNYPVIYWKVCADDLHIDRVMTINLKHKLYYY